MLLLCVLFLFIFESSSSAFHYNGMIDSNNETDASGRAITTVDASTSCCNCVKSYQVVKQPKVDFYKAITMCLQNGMELASINNAAEENAIINSWKLVGTEVGWDLGLWVSGTRHGASGSNFLQDFVWITTGKPMLYRNYLPGQPDNAGNKENCILLAMNEQQVFGWGDGDCDARRQGFVCQTKCCCP